jgi:prevent-host-death family protein
MLEAISVTDARKDFLPLIDRVESELHRFMVTRHGKPVAVVLGYEEYSRMVETLKLMDDSEMARDIRRGSAEAGLGKLIEMTDTGGNGG